MLLPISGQALGIEQLYVRSKKLNKNDIKKQTKNGTTQRKAVKAFNLFYSSTFMMIINAVVCDESNRKGEAPGTDRLVITRTHTSRNAHVIIKGRVFCATDISNFG